ncbi:hypothetical protein LINGRAHAP2_LOCUS12209, partial [Linum grandiflorum]
YPNSIPATKFTSLCRTTLPSIAADSPPDHRHSQSFSVLESRRLLQQRRPPPRIRQSPSVLLTSNSEFDFSIITSEKPNISTAN